MRIIDDETPRRPFAERANRLHYQHPPEPYPVWKLVTAAAFIFVPVAWALTVFLWSLIDG